MTTLSPVRQSNGVKDVVAVAVAEDLIMKGMLKRIDSQPNCNGVEHRREFINSMPTLLLFKPRNLYGLATHYILVTDWWKLTFVQIVAMRRNYEQCCF